MQAAIAGKRALAGRPILPIQESVPMNSTAQQIFRITTIVSLVLTTACAQDFADMGTPQRTAGAIATGGVLIDQGRYMATGQDCGQRSVGAVQGGGVVIDRGCTWR